MTCVSVSRFRPPSPVDDTTDLDQADEERARGAPKRAYAVGLDRLTLASFNLMANWAQRGGTDAQI
jgi:hypothetical protein